MADIQMVYREGYCEIGSTKYNTQCHTAAGEDMPCRGFKHPEHEQDESRKVIPFGDCAHAKFRYIYEGLVVKKYRMEPLEDPYNIHLNCMLVRTGGRTYACEKVILNGQCIYDNTDEQEAGNDG